MSLLDKKNIPSNSVIFIPDASIERDAEKYLGFTLNEMKEHSYFDEYINSITLPKPMKIGSNITKGGLEIKLFPNKTVQFQNGALVSILSMKKYEQINSIIVYIPSIFILPEQIAKFKTNGYLAELEESLKNLQDPSIPGDDRVFYPSNVLEIMIRTLNYQEIINLCSSDKSFQQWCTKYSNVIWKYLLDRDYQQIKISEVENPKAMYIYLVKVRKFIEKNVTDKPSNWDFLSQNLSLPVEFWEKNLDRVNWYYLSRNRSLPVEFFERHLKKVNWAGISFNPSLPVEFWEKHIDKVDWNGLSQNPFLPVEFWERHLKKVDWFWLSQNPSLPVDFFERHLDKVNRGILSRNPSLPLEFFEKHLEKLSWHGLSRNPAVPLEFFEQHLDKISWNGLSMNPSLPVEFFERHLKKVNWARLSANPSLPPEFFEKNLDKVDWNWLSTNPSLPVEFWERHSDEVDWERLSSNPSLPVEFFERHLDEVDWEGLSQNPSLPLEFWEKYPKKFRITNVGFANPMLPRRYFKH